MDTRGIRCSLWCISWLVVHELIIHHLVSFGANHFAINFGFQLETLTPDAHLKEPGVNSSRLVAFAGLFWPPPILISAYWVVESFPCWLIQLVPRVAMVNSVVVRPSKLARGRSPTKRCYVMSRNQQEIKCRNQSLIRKLEQSDQESEQGISAVTVV